MPRRSLVTQNNAAPCLGPRQSLDRASTPPSSPLLLPATTACTPSLATATTRIAFLMRTALPRPQAPDVHGPHTPRHAHFVRTPPPPRARPTLAIALTLPWPALPRTPLALTTATR